jgi:hypothetical protein
MTSSPPGANGTIIRIGRLGHFSGEVFVVCALMGIDKSRQNARKKTCLWEGICYFSNIFMNRLFVKGNLAAYTSQGFIHIFEK